MDQGRVWVAKEASRADRALQERRQRGGTVAVGFQVHDLDAHVGGGILAGAVAFRLFLFLVPFVYVVFTIFGLAARITDEHPADLARTMGITGVLASAVVNTQERSAGSQFFLLLGATVALVIAAISFTKAVYVVHWLIWRVPRKKPTVFLPVVVVIGITLVVSVLGTLLNQLRSAQGLFGSMVVILIVMSASFGMWWWVSANLPHAPTPRRALIPGAILMAVGVCVLQLITTYWIGHLVARKSNTYGAVGIALAVLLWVYILGRIIIGSAGLNATLWLRHGDRPDDSVNEDEQVT